MRRRRRRAHPLASSRTAPDPRGGGPSLARRLHRPTTTTASGATPRGRLRVTVGAASPWPAARRGRERRFRRLWRRRADEPAARARPQHAWRRAARPAAVAGGPRHGDPGPGRAAGLRRPAVLGARTWASSTATAATRARRTCSASSTRASAGGARSFPRTRGRPWRRPSARRTSRCRARLRAQDDGSGSTAVVCLFDGPGGGWSWRTRRLAVRAGARGPRREPDASGAPTRKASMLRSARVMPPSARLRFRRRCLDVRMPTAPPLSSRREVLHPNIERPSRRSASTPSSARRGSPELHPRRGARPLRSQTANPTPHGHWSSRPPRAERSLVAFKTSAIPRSSSLAGEPPPDVRVTPGAVRDGPPPREPAAEKRLAQCRGAPQRPRRKTRARQCTVWNSSCNFPNCAGESINQTQGPSHQRALQ